jgi:hypothetical protein
MSRAGRTSWVLCLVGVGAVASVARADIPAGYKGTPFRGTPWPIPGRLEFENVDLGGINVAWKEDDHGNTASGKDYRPGDTDLPQISACNVNGFVDKLTDGTIYPSPTMQQCYYIGWAHAGDWVKLTVDVKRAGKYRISSTFAAEAPTIGFDLAFNDVSKGSYSLPGTSNLHVWKRFDEIATIDLDAGLQVMQFTATVLHLQFDYLELTLVDGSGDAGATDGGASMPGAADASAAGGAAADGGTAGTSGGSGGASAGMGGGAAGIGGGGSAGPAGAAGGGDVSGTTTGNAGAGGSVSTGSGGGAASQTPSRGGCALSGSGDASLFGVGLFAALALRARRRVARARIHSSSPRP